MCLKMEYLTKQADEFKKKETPQTIMQYDSHCASKVNMSQKNVMNRFDRGMIIQHGSNLW